ncbi:MAG: hypothetical protein HYZ26_02790 [Chloroflexi bacterium]|nr:hypothetical protein [Chloroflexota bacterium]
MVRPAKALRLAFRVALPAVVMLTLLLPLPAEPAAAQTYAFSLDSETVDVYWQNNGTLSLGYEFVFTNAAYASPLDFVDVGMPTSGVNPPDVSATINGIAITHIADSPYVTNGIELGLGVNAIRPGDTGVVRVQVSEINNVLYVDSTDPDYASAVFSPTWFGSEFVSGSTNFTVTFHLPAGVQPDEPRFHRAPYGWPEEPITGFDNEGRITYTWQNSVANGYTQYLFGASFPARLVPSSAIVQPSLWQRLGIEPEALIGFGIFCTVGLFIFGIPVIAISGERRRKMKYLPPRIAVQGHGIKRGLTAIEAAILLEQPMDRILAMILFATLKKSAAAVMTEKPLRLEVAAPLPPDLRPYETDFLDAMKETNTAKRRKLLQEAMIRLIRSVAQKMKGFSHRETVSYYKDIMERAWQEVEAAKTPEMLSETYDKVMEWTMLDKEYEDRSRDVFQNRPIYAPHWYGRYNPTYGSRPSGTSAKSGAPASRPTPGGVGLPHLPGSDFAASIVNGVQNFSAGVIGNLSDFTGGVTKTTNPPPVTSTSSYRSSGGSGCACACACAGCACACAGGGR